MTGSLIFSKDRINSKETSVKLDAPAGNYLIRISNQSKTVTRKIILKYTYE